MSIEKELLELTGIKSQKKKETDQTYLKRILVAIDKADDEKFFALSDETQKWVDNAIDAVEEISPALTRTKTKTKTKTKTRMGTTTAKMRTKTKMGTKTKTKMGTKMTTTAKTKTKTRMGTKMTTTAKTKTKTKRRRKP